VRRPPTAAGEFQAPLFYRITAEGLKGSPRPKDSW